MRTRKFLIPAISTIAAALILTGCSGAHPASFTGEGSSAVADSTTQAVDADSGDIELVATRHLTLAGKAWSATYYVNHSYQCGRTGDFPFLVVEPADAGTSDLPLWVLLHGGGVGFYGTAGHYFGPEKYNDQESAKQLGAMLLRFTDAGSADDTFVSDRIAAGDRFVLGSLCDHDLMLGLGQSYPNNPRGTDQTVDGLLANLAMLDAVRHGAADVTARPTSATYILGTSAGAYGAYGLAQQLWQSGDAPNGVVLDSGVLTTSRRQLVESGAMPVGGESEFALDGLAAKLGPYFTDESLWLENQIAAGFDVPLFLTTQTADKGCTADDSTMASEHGYVTSCEWIVGTIAEAIAAYGVPAVQQVHTYPGSTHTASDLPSTPLQTDLRNWYAAIS